MKFILTIDLGATKLAAGVFESTHTVKAPIWEKSFPSKNFISFEDALDCVLQEVSFELMAIVIGFPGPVTSHSFILTNLPWEINVEKIEQKYSNIAIYILNDVEAASYSVLSLPNNSFLTLNHVKAEIGGIKAFVSFGTGVGEAFLLRHERNWRAYPTERGHLPFTAFHERDEKLLEIVHKKKVATTEEVMGKGALSRLYRFLNPTAREFPPESVVDLATDGNELAVQSIEWYLEMVMREAQKVALSFIPKGGIYLAGGVIQALYPWAESKWLMKAFLDHPSMSKLLNEIPIFIVKESNCSLWGLATYSLKER